MTHNPLDRLLDLERSLKEALRHRRGFNDVHVQSLTADFRDAAVCAINEQPAAAAKHGVEVALWKLVFYKHIEQYRKAIKVTGQQAGRCKLLKIYRKKLNEFTNFYKSLLQQQKSKISDKYPYSLSTAHRCLIYLGDLGM